MDELYDSAEGVSREVVTAGAPHSPAGCMAYETPVVRKFGTVEDLTTAVTGAGADGGTASMAGG